MSEKTVCLNNEIKKERNYGIDVLRIISMFLVVVLHVNKFPGVLAFYEKNTLGYDFAWITEAFAICAVNVYAIISGYVLVKAKFKLKRLLGLYLEVLFFNIISYVLIVIHQGGFNGVKDFLLNMFFFLPLMSDDHWYFKAYFLMFFIFPLLNLAIKNMEKKHFVLLFAVVAVLICVVSLYRDYSWGIKEGYSTLWLITMYFIGAYLSKFGLLKFSASKSLLFYLIFTLAIFLGKIINNILPDIQLDTENNVFNLKYDTYAYTSFLVVLQSVFLFNAFAKIKVQNQKLQKALLFISPLTFGVYVVHCTAYFKIFLKENFENFAFITQGSVWLVIPLVLGISVLVFLGCALIEWVRQLIFKYTRIDKGVLLLGDAIQNKLSNFAEKKN